MEAIERVAKHLSILNDEVGTIQVSMAEIRTDISWLKRGQLWILGLLGSGFVTAVCWALFK